MKDRNVVELGVTVEYGVEIFDKYEKVRSSGEFNMFDSRAIEKSGLSVEDYTFVMKNYDELRRLSLGEKQSEKKSKVL